MVAAAKQLGWNVTVFDGKFSPDVMVSGLRQAVADGADGVVVAYADCADIKAGLEDLAKAGIPVVNIESTDCDVSVGDDGACRIRASPDCSTPRWLRQRGRSRQPADLRRGLEDLRRLPGSWHHRGTQGGAKIIVLSELDIRLNFVSLRSLKETLKKYCPDCEIVDTVKFTGADLGPGLQDKVAQALVQHPDANAVYGIYDARPRTLPRG